MLCVTRVAGCCGACDGAELSAVTMQSRFDKPHSQLVLKAGEPGVSKPERAADLPGGAANLGMLSEACNNSEKKEVHPGGLGPDWWLASMM